MSRGLDSYLADIKAAEAMLNAAKEDYKAAALEKFEAGLLVEKREANWAYFNDGKLLCKGCNAIVSSNQKYNFCPNCGAKMLNSSYVPRILEEQTTSASVKTYRELLRELYDKGLTYAAIGKGIGTNGTSVKGYMTGEMTPRKKTIEAIKEFYKKEMM